MPDKCPYCDEKGNMIDQKTKEAFRFWADKIAQRVLEIETLDTDAVNVIACNEINAAAAGLVGLSRTCAVEIISRQMGA